MFLRVFSYFLIICLTSLMNFGQNLPFPFKKSLVSHFNVKELEFIENKNQWDSKVEFYAKLNEANIWFEKDRITFDLFKPSDLDKFFKRKFLNEEERKLQDFDGVVNSHAYTMKFANSNPEVKVEGKGVLPHFLNYFIGNDKSKWASEVRVFDEALYKSLYDGIDLRIYSYEGKLKYDYIVAVGANPAAIEIEFEGLESFEIRNKNLLMRTSVNTVEQMQPYAYQEIEGEVQEVKCEFRIRNNKLIYVFPNSYNKNYELIIDPVLIFSSYSGSNADNWGYTATYDLSGNLYAGGNAFNVGYPVTLGAFQTNFAQGVCDIAISKFNSNGSNLVYSTYLGGSGSEVPHSLIVNKQGELFVYGTTGSANFPMAGNSFDNTFNGGTNFSLTNIISFPNGSDIIVAKFNSAGTQLLASTFIGGSGNDGLNMFTPLRHNYADDCRGEIMLDENDNVYIVSTTASTNFPVTAGSFQPTYGGGSLDGCIVKLDNSLSNIIWASYLGGSGIDAIYSISLDKNENLIVGGGTTSNNFPTTPNAIRSTYQGGSADGFITRIDKNGIAIIRSTYWGTSSYDQVYFVEVDRNDNVYALGQSLHAGTQLHFNATWFNPGGGVFITKFQPQLNAMEWSTTFGTSPGVINISPTAFMVDKCNSIYLSGWGSNTLGGNVGTAGLPITSNAIQSTTDNNDYYFMALKDDASALVYATFFGGSSREHVDGGTSRFDKMGKIYQAVCAGCGGLDDFPTTPGVHSNINQSNNCNIGVVKIDFMIPAIVADYSTNAPVCLPSAVNFTNNSNTPNPSSTICFWDFGDGNTSSSCSPTHVYSSSGLYNVKLIMSDANSCNLSDTIIKQVLVLSNSSDTIPTKYKCEYDVVQIGVPPSVGMGLTYQWQPTTGLSNPNITNPMCSVTTNTLYTLFVSNGVCTDTLYQFVEVISLNVDAGNDTSICNLNYTLKLNSVSGGTVYTYLWSTNNQFTDTLNASLNDDFANIIVSNPAWYYVKVFSENCSGIDSLYVDFVSFQTSFTTVMPLCFGDCNGELSVNVSGGNSPYSYLWSNNNETTQSISSVCAGSYSVKITDQDGCETLANIILNQPDSIKLKSVITPVNCIESCHGKIRGIASGGTSPYQYSWSNGQTDSVIKNLCPGIYSLTVTDNNLCQKSMTGEIIVTDFFDNIEVWADDYNLWEGQSTWLYSTNILALSYEWTPSNWLGSPYNSSTLATPPPGEHTFYVKIDDGKGCIYLDSLKITVNDVFCFDPYLFIPNAFTPDKNNQNDVFFVRGIYIDEMELLIFNRWGELVYESKDKNKGWDGRYKGVLVDPGVFTYYLKIKCYNKVEYIKTGNVTVIR